MPLTMRRDPEAGGEGLVRAGERPDKSHRKTPRHDFCMHSTK